MVQGSGRGRGQSSVLGYLLVFAIVVSSIALIVVVGGAGLTDTQSQSEFQRAEHSMTLFDSRTAMVGLGDASVQTVSLGHDSGQIAVEDDSGWMRVTHDNYTQNSTASREVIFNETLGQVRYANGDRTIGYQGGGVWQQDTTGAAQMLSPPEFHYRGATLTLPIIRVGGSGAASGSVDMTVRPGEETRLVYPNRTTVTSNGVGAPYDNTTDDRNYTNPVRNGSVNVTVHSEYYEGWATYFEQRTTGNVTTWDHNETVRLELETVSGPPRDFEMPPVGDTVEVGAVGEGHPLTEFEVEIAIEKQGPHFSFYAEEGGKELELHVYSDVKNNPCPSPDGDVYISTYYYDGDGSETFESWESDGLDPNDPDNGLSWQCDSDDDLSLKVDFINGSIDMTYDEIGSSGTFDPGKTDDPNCGGSTEVTRGNKYAFNDHIDTGCEDWQLDSTATWDQHANSVDYEKENGDHNYSQNDTESLGEVNNHYMGAMGDDFSLVAKDGPGNSDSINEQASSGTLLYNESASAEYVTFLHITENQVEVDLRG